MTAVAAVQRPDADLARLTGAFRRWPETGARTDELFAADVFADVTLPHWRLQADSADAAFGLREGSHPYPGTVSVRGLDRTTRGFLTEIEERWVAGGQRWYCRELMHCVVDQDRISELHVYCCGDWDEELQRRHAREVHLVRP